MWSARPPQITVRSTVGAGDRSLAGYLLADLAGAPPAERLRTAVAYGAASASLPGSAVPTPAQVDVSSSHRRPGRHRRAAQPAATRSRPGPGRRPGRPLTLRERLSMPELITPDLVALDADLGADKSAVVRRLAELVAAAGRATAADALHADAMAREAQAPTGLPGGIAIPHCRSEAVTEASLGFARLSPKVDFGAPDGPADLVFLIAAPAHGDADHLTLLTALARALVRPDFVASLRAATSAEEIVRSCRTSSPRAPAARPPRPPRLPRPPPLPAAAAAGRKSIVVVSACPTGIAHTYMAADKLVAAGKAAGVDIHVETQGSSGSTPLDPAVIRGADAVIFAVDVGVKDQDRFAGKPVVQSGTKRAINEPDVMIREALAAADDPNARRVAGAVGGRGRPAAPVGGGAEHWHRDPPLAAHRRQLHDPVRRGRRPAHRAGLPLRRLPDRHLANPDVEGQSYAPGWVLNNSLFDLPVRTASRVSTAVSWATSGPICTVLGSGRPSPSSCRRWPATSPTPSPTGPASRPASSSVWSPCRGGRRLHRRPDRRHPRRPGRAVDQQLEAPDRRPRSAAGRHHPAARHAHLQRPHGARPRPPAGRGGHRPDELAQRPERHVRDPARRSSSA